MRKINFVTFTKNIYGIGFYVEKIDKQNNTIRLGFYLWNFYICVDVDLCVK